MWPTAVFVTTGLVLTPVAAFLDVSEPILDQASWAVTIILWFVAAYMLIAAITPLSIRAHDRWGLGFVVAIVAVVAATDAVRFVAGSETLAYANYALVWAAFHQIGFAWRDGLVPSGRKPFYLAASASALLVALVAWGPYPVSMVGVPGAEIQNTGPPTLALLTHGLALIGIALALRRWIKRWLERSRVWTAVASANLAIMSIFLWHVVPVVLLASVFAAFEFSLPGPSEASEWLAYRPIWVIMLAALLIPIVLIVRLVERPPEWLESLANRHGRSGVTLAAGLVGVTAASAGLARLAVVGFWVGEPTLVPVWEAIAFLGGFAVAVGAGVLGDHA